MSKIAFIDVTATVSYGGIQTAVWRLAAALAGMGHETAVFGGDGAIRPEGAERVAVQTFPYIPREKFPDFGSRFQRIAERWSFARQARQAVIAGAYDWAILTKPFDFFWPWRMPPESATRFAFMSGGTDFFRGDRLLAKKIDAWLACSHFNAWQIQSRYKRFPAVIYNGVDCARFSPDAADAGLRGELGFAADDVAFAFAGRLVGWKGLALALRALAEPALAGLPVKLLLVGDGPKRGELRQLAQKLGVAGRVVFRDAVPHHDLPRYYASCDAGVFPSIGDEAFGITIAEAMSCARPVVASHVGGIPEVVGNEESCGLLVAPGDAPALAAAMARLARDPRLRAALGVAARRRIESRYTWEMSARRMAAALGLEAAPPRDPSRQK